MLHEFDKHHPFGSLANDTSSPSDKVCYNKLQRSARWSLRLRLVDFCPENTDGRMLRRAIQLSEKYTFVARLSFANVVRVTFEDKADLGGGTLIDK